MSVFDNNRYASFGMYGAFGYHPINEVPDKEKKILKELDELKDQLLDQANKLNAFLSKNNGVLAKFGIVPNIVIQHQGKVFQINVSLDSGYVQRYITERFPNWNNPLGAYETPWATPIQQQYGVTGNPYGSMDTGKYRIKFIPRKPNDVFNAATDTIITPNGDVRDIFMQLKWTTPNEDVPNCVFDKGKRINVTKENIIGKIEVYEHNRLCRFDRPMIGTCKLDSTLNLNGPHCPDELDFVVMQCFLNEAGKARSTIKSPKPYDEPTYTLVFVNNDLYMRVANGNLLRLCYEDIPEDKKECCGDKNCEHCKGHTDYPYTFMFPRSDGGRQDFPNNAICELDPTGNNNHKTVFDFDWVSVGCPLIGIYRGSKVAVKGETFLGTLTVFKDEKVFDVTRSVLPFDDGLDAPVTFDRQEFPRKFYDDLYEIIRDEFKKKTGCKIGHIINGTFHDEPYTVLINNELYQISPRGLILCKRLPKVKVVEQMEDSIIIRNESFKHNSSLDLLADGTHVLDHDYITSVGVVVFKDQAAYLGKITINEQIGGNDVAPFVIDYDVIAYNTEDPKWRTKYNDEFIEKIYADLNDSIHSLFEEYAHVSLENIKHDKYDGKYYIVSISNILYLVTNDLLYKLVVAVDGHDDTIAGVQQSVITDEE